MDFKVLRNLINSFILLENMTLSKPMDIDLLREE